MEVSRNGDTPKIIYFNGIFMDFPLQTIHFGVPGTKVKGGKIQLLGVPIYNITYI